MSSDNTTSGPSTEALVVAYYALTLIIVGTSFNLITFVILCRSTFRDTKVRPTLHYMRTMAIFDTLMLYGWNLDHYLSTVPHIFLFQYSIFTCRLISFLSYFSCQVSAWLRVFVSLDRYLALSRLQRIRLSRSRNVLLIIACIIIVFLLLNFQFFLFDCYYDANGVITPYSWLFDVYPLWDYINLGVYNCAPFILMVIFNSSVVYHLLRLRRTTTLRNSRIQHRAISITLVITTTLFLLMTIPSSIAFAFFTSANTTILHLLDGLLYSYHVLSFPVYMITLDEFRREFIAMIPCKKNNQRVAPQTRTVPHTLS